MASRSSTPREVSSSVVALSVPIPVVTEGFSSSTDVQIHPCYRLAGMYGVFSSACQDFAPLYCVKMVVISFRITWVSTEHIENTACPCFISPCQLVGNDPITQIYQDIIVIFTSTLTKGVLLLMNRANTV